MIDPITKEGTHAIKSYSKEALIMSTSDEEGWKLWAASTPQGELAPDRTPPKGETPVVWTIKAPRRLLNKIMP